MLLQCKHVSMCLAVDCGNKDYAIQWDHVAHERTLLVANNMMAASKWIHGKAGSLHHKDSVLPMMTQTEQMAKRQ